MAVRTAGYLVEKSVALTVDLSAVESVDLTVVTTAALMAESLDVMWGWRVQRKVAPKVDGLVATTAVEWAGSMVLKLAVLMAALSVET
jgi:hypothetical protein